jgi:hypothetical protein
MSIKTEYLNLDKLQENEYYSSDIENNNLDKIDEELKSNEKRTRILEDKVNQKEELSTHLTPQKRIQSVDDSVAGSCQYEITGSLSEQLIHNGNFDNDLNEIEGLSSTIGLSNKILSARGTGGTYTAVKLKAGEYRENDNIFIFARLKTREENCKRFDLGLYSEDVHGLHQVISIDNPIKDRWYEIFGKVTISRNSSGLLIPVARFDDATDKIMEIDGRVGLMAFKLLAEDNNLTPKQLKKKYIDGGYFEGLKPLSNVSIHNKSRNLFLKSAVRPYDGKITETKSGFIYDGRYYSQIDKSHLSLEIGKSYTIFCNYKKLEGESITPYWLYFYCDGTYSTQRYFNKGSLLVEKEVCKLLIYSAGTIKSKYEFSDINLVEGVISENNYQPTVSSKVVIEDKLAKLPNLVADKILSQNGKTIKYSYTNVGKESKFLEIKGADITSDLQTSASNINYAYTDKNFIKDMILGTSGIDGASFMKGRREAVVDSHVWNSNYLSYIYSLSPDGRIYFSFPKTITTIEEARSQIDRENLKFSYELKEPVIEELNDIEPLNTFNHYTNMCIESGVIENEKATLLNDSQNYVLNVEYLNGETKLKHKVKHFTDIYELSNDGRQSIFNLGSFDYDKSAYGNQRWWIPPKVVKENNVNINQIYVDYVTNETNNLADVKINYNANISSAVSSNVSSLGAIGNQVDLNSKELDYLGKSLEWIEPTLINNWVPFGIDTEHTASYCKEFNGYVNLRGTIRGGVQGELFTLPIGFRPQKNETFAISSNYRFAEVVIFANGSVQVRGGSGEFISLTGIRFIHER